MSREDHRNYDKLLRQMRENAVPEAERSKESKRNRRAGALGILGLAAGCGSWAYFVLAANPSFYFGVTLLLLCGLFMEIAAIEYFPRRITKIVSTVVILIATFYTVKWARSQWELKIQNDVAMHLDISMNASPTGNLWKSIVKVKNNSSSPLSQHNVTCKVNGLISVNSEGGGITLERVGLTNLPLNEPLAIGGDSSTDNCLNGNPAQWFSPQPPIKCADVTVMVIYAVDSHPKVMGTKPLRFITEGAEWRQEPVGRQSITCKEN